MACWMELICRLSENIFGIQIFLDLDWLKPPNKSDNDFPSSNSCGLSHYYFLSLLCLLKLMWFFLFTSLYNNNASYPSKIDWVSYQLLPY